MRYFRKSFLFMLASLFIFAGCAKVEEPDYYEHEYGYIQFKLYKAVSYDDTKAAGAQLE